MMLGSSLFLWATQGESSENRSGASAVPVISSSGANRVGPADTLDPSRRARPDDPNFYKFTKLPEPVKAASCEFKPVMADSDYWACGVTPPRLPLARQSD